MSSLLPIAAIALCTPPYRRVAGPAASSSCLRRVCMIDAEPFSSSAADALRAMEARAGFLSDEAAIADARAEE
eukprot:6662501-Prymnesium_polylepis.1